MRGLALLVAALLLALPASAKKIERQIIGAEQDHSIAQVGDCGDFFKTVFTAFPAAANDQEQREISLTGIDRLRVTASQEGGVSVRGWSRPAARLIVCRSAVAQTKVHASRTLEMIKVVHNNGEISAYGPANDDTQAWWVNIILYVPRRATVDVRAANGGVAIRNVDGNVTAHATTGGISVAQGTGSYKISTESGGITLDRLSGRVEAASNEGAIAFKVPGGDLPAIEAHTNDDGHILCHLARCETGLGSWTSDRKTLRIGGPAPSVKLSTAGSAIIIDHVR
ncbi:MAG TPA: hypothetical protein VEU30_16910 [Thermoanaerobaculia bacterium]|nr:hypothetical protein [Thermoanaerobaculia bacterium]